MKPPFSYYGGKIRIASKIIPYIPRHTLYVEPFCGSATLLFMKPRPSLKNQHHYEEYINDTNGDVINFFRQLQTNGEPLVKMLQVTPRSEEEFSRYKKQDWSNNLERAYLFYTVIRQSFSAKIGGGWVFSKTKNFSYDWFNGRNRLGEYIERMQQVSISRRPALELIEKLDSPQTFFYCDPPYPGTDQGHYRGYTKSDLVDLAYMLKNCNGSAIVSNYEHDKVFKDFGKVEIDAVCTASKNSKSKRTEILYVKQPQIPNKKISKILENPAFDCFEGKQPTITL